MLEPLSGKVKPFKDQCLVIELIKEQLPSCTFSSHFCTCISFFFYKSTCVGLDRIVTILGNIRVNNCGIFFRLSLCNRLLHLLIIANSPRTAVSLRQANNYFCHRKGG